MADLIQEILARIFGGVIKEVAKKAGVDNLIGDILHPGKGGSGLVRTEPSKFIECKEPYKGELPEGLFAFVDYSQSEEGDVTNIFVISRDFKGNVTLDVNGSKETIAIGPCERKYFETKIQPVAGIKAQVTAEGKTLELKANYDSFPAYYYDGEMFLNSPEPEEKDGDLWQYINDGTVLAPGGAASMIFGISKREDNFEPQNKDTVFYAVVEKENLAMNDKNSQKMIKYGRLEPDKTYYYFALIYDAGRNFMSGYGSQPIVYKD